MVDPSVPRSLSTPVQAWDSQAFEAAFLPPESQPGLEEAASLPGLPQARFEMLDLMGAGGQGLVARARDRALDRLVALKWLRSATPGEADQLLREARAQASLDHPHICRIYETGLHYGRPFIVMQLVEGHPIHQALAKASLQEKATVLRMAAEAVHAAHEQGLIHRDLKPSNLLVTRTRDGLAVPRLLDFGMAVPQEDLRRGLVRGGAGTPAYMAPEQALSDPTLVDRRSDVWALGAILFELATDRLPFPDLKGLADLQRQHAAGVPDPCSLRPDLPPDLGAIIRKALALHPAQRYPTARALGEDLARFVQGEPVAARTPTGWERGSRWLRGHRYLVAGLVATLAVAAVVLTLRARSQAQTHQALGYSQRAKDLELRLLEIRNLPPAKVGAAITDVRAALARLELELDKAPPRVQGPARAALGQVALALDEPEDAGRHFESAHRLGFQSAESELGLGIALAQLLDRRSQALTEMPPQARAQQMQGLAQTLAQPALALLQRRRKDTPHPELIQARILAAERHFLPAIELLEVRLSKAPWATAHRRFLAELRTQAYIQAEAYDPNLERAALEAIRAGRSLAPGDALYDFFEAMVHASACEWFQRQNRDAVHRYAAAEAALGRALALDPDHGYALQLQANLPFVRAVTLANRLEDNAALWEEGHRRCQGILTRHPSWTWPRDILIRHLPIWAKSLRAEAPERALALAEEGLGHYHVLVPKAGKDVLASLRTFAAMAHFVRASVKAASGQEALPACEAGLALLGELQNASPHERGLASDLLVLKASLVADGRSAMAQALQLREAGPREDPDQAYERVNLAILHNQAAGEGIARFGADPLPNLTRSRAELAAARKVASELVPRIEALALLADGVEARWDLDHGRDVTALLARMERTYPANPGPSRPYARVCILHLQGLAADLRGQPPTQALAGLEAFRKDPQVWAEAEHPWLELSLAAARHALVAGQPGRAGTLLNALRAHTPTPRGAPTVAERHFTLALEPERLLLEAALAPGLQDLWRSQARSTATKLAQEWPNTAKADWALAVAKHLEGHAADWKGLESKHPALKGLLAKTRRLREGR